MRTKTLLLIAATLGSSLLGACKWTEFDDIENETWVDSAGKPGSVKSSDYGVAIARGSQSGASGGKLVVLGAGEASYSELAYDAKGASSSPSDSIGLKTLYGIANLAPQPVLITDPSTDEISLIVGSDNGIAMLTGASGTLKLYQLFNQAQPDAATYMLAPTQTKPLPLVAVGANVLGALLPALPTNTNQPICKLVDSATAGFTAKIRALGVARVAPATTDDVLAWDAGGKLYKYPGSVFGGCATAEPIGAVDTAFQPDTGSQILAIDATHVLLQGHNATGGMLQVFDVAAMAAVGPAAMVPGLRTAALLTATSGRFVIAGVPTEAVAGDAVGQAKLFTLAATGVGTTPVAAFNDAQPESNQSFGRGVAAMPYNGTQVIAVAANNEVFVYFRANLADGTVLYDETRQGR